jgi:hypothetical protein
MEKYLKGFDFDNEDNYVILDDGSDLLSLEKLLIEYQENTKLGIIIRGYADLDNAYGYGVTEDVNLAKVIPRLPNNLKFLSLQCSLIGLSPNTTLYSSIPSIPTISILALPNSLEYLELEISLHDIYYTDCLDYLFIPKSVKSISVICKSDIHNTNEINFINRCHKPQCSVYHDKNTAQNSIDKIIAKLPYHLEYIKCNFFIPNIDKFKNLKTFIISGDWDNERFNEPLNNLPSSLEWLSIYPYGFNQSLNNLPFNLKILVFCENRIWNYNHGYEHGLSNLPIGLEVLCLPENIRYDGTMTNDDVTLNNLPINLRYLSIPEHYEIPGNKICELPDSIEIIKWNSFLSVIKFDSSKRLLDIRLPKSLKIIIGCHKDDIKEIKELKSNYSYLEYIDDIINKIEFI